MEILIAPHFEYIVLTHDSIGLGEDGPTHQPVEHAAMLRMTPDMEVWRPCDMTETAVAWRLSIERQNGPSALLLSRQKLQHQKRNQQQLNLTQMFDGQVFGFNDYERAPPPQYIEDKQDNSTCRPNITSCGCNDLQQSDYRGAMSMTSSDPTTTLHSPAKCKQLPL